MAGVASARAVGGWRPCMAAAVTVAASAMVAACASKPASVAPPPNPIRLLAVLPVAPLEEGVGFAGQRVPTPIVILHGAPTGAAVTALGAGIVVGAIVQSAREEKHKEQVALNEAMSVLNFDLAAQADEHIAAALQRQALRVVHIRDAAVAAQVRAGRFDGLASDVDAYLDIVVEENRYEHSRRAGGYAPVVNLSATIRPLNEQADDLAGFTYYADARDGGKNKRWWTTPPSMIFKTLDALKADTPRLRTELDALVRQMSASMARDIGRRAAGEVPDD